MPKRKTADAELESVVKAESGKKRSSAPKASTSPAATHKRTATKVATQSSAVGTADPVAIVPAAETVSNPAVPVPNLDFAVASASAPAPTARKLRPTHEQIALRAYSLWEGRGYQPGSPEEDWLRAERQLTEVE